MEEEYLNVYLKESVSKSFAESKVSEIDFYNLINDILLQTSNFIRG